MDQKPFESREEFEQWSMAQTRAVLKKNWNKGKAVCILRKRTVNTAIQIVESIDCVPFLNLSLTLYHFTKNKEFQNLCRDYEYALELALINRDKFVAQLDKFYTKQAEKIKDNNMLHPFLEFLVWFLDKQNSTKDDTEFRVFCSYANLVMQQLEYLRPNKYAYNDMVCGVTTDGEPICIHDPFPSLDYGNMLLDYEMLVEKQEISFTRLQQIFAKLGYTQIRKEIDYISILNASKIFTNDVAHIAPFVNEYTTDMLPAVPLDPQIRSRDWGRPAPIDFSFEELLVHRRRTLPANGLTVSFSNARIFHSLLLKECFHDSEIVLLFKLNTIRGDITGCYMTKRQKFRSSFERAVDIESQNEGVRKDPEYTVMKHVLRRTVLWAYASYVCDNINVLPTTEGFRKYILDDPANVHFSSIGGKLQKTYESESSGKKKDMEKYEAEKVSINGFVRRLPAGQKASEKARAIAQELGFELKEGETYVQPFIRISWILTAPTIYIVGFR